MNRNLRDIIVAALIAAAVTFALGGIYIARAEASPALPGVTVCQEDDPCWTPLMGDGNGRMYCLVAVINGEVYLDDCQPVGAR